MENNCLAKPKIIVNVWTNTKIILITGNGMRSRTGMSFKSGAKGLEPARDLE